MDLEQRWKELCALAAVEKDPGKLSELVSEIMRLIDLQQKRAKTGTVEQCKEKERRRRQTLSDGQLTFKHSDRTAEETRAEQFHWSLVTRTFSLPCTDVALSDVVPLPANVPFAPVCPICSSPVALEQANSDENGTAIHEACYLLKLRLRLASSGRSHVSQDREPSPYVV